MRTLRALYLLADTGIAEQRIPLWPSHPGTAPLALTHRDAVEARLVEVLAPVFQHH